MSVEQKTKQTIYNTAKRIAREVAANLSIEFDDDTLDMVAELTYKKILSYGFDLDAFQKTSVETRDTSVFQENNIFLEDTDTMNLLQMQEPKRTKYRCKKSMDGNL